MHSRPPPPSGASHVDEEFDLVSTEQPEEIIESVATVADVNGHSVKA